MAPVHWNWHSVTFGTALAANRSAAKAAVVALMEQASRKELFAGGDPRAQGGGHAPVEGPWNCQREKRLSYGAKHDAKGRISAVSRTFVVSSSTQRTENAGQ